MTFHVLTLFPEMVRRGLEVSITGRAIQQNKIGLETVNIRDFTEDKHGRVDDYTYGGGAGMLMQAQPVYDAYRSVASRLPDESDKRVIYLTPQGVPFTQSLAEELAACDDLVLLCGHYEGIDERVLEEVVTDYISIGDYVLTGGELAAMVVVDAVARLVPSVLHNGESAWMESFHGNLLEYPQYTRPEEWHGKGVPPVLLGGNRNRIDEWRRQKAEERTRERRPDLYGKYCALEGCRKLLMRRKLHHMDMIELIDRGRAVLIACEEHGNPDGADAEILLMDKQSHIYFHTWMQFSKDSSVSGRRSETLLRRLPELCVFPAEVISLHQGEFVDVAAGLGYRLDMECFQAVYTRREKLPIRGLYRADLKGLDQKESNPNSCRTGGEHLESIRAGGIEIRQLTMEHFPIVSSVYRTVDDGDYVRDRIEKGAVYGAFSDGELAGFIGVHSEGSIGLLEVLPEYRRRGIAMALETWLSNRFIEHGMTPYGQIVTGNEGSCALQRRLGLCFAKETVFWLSRES